MAKAVIFDMDGVLCDSEPIYFRVMREVIAETGGNLDEHAYRGLIGWTPDATWAWLGTQFGFAHDLPRWRARYDTAVTLALRRDATPSAGLLPLLATLEASRVPVGLASSSLPHWIGAILDALDVRRHFPVVVSGVEVQYGKPAPDIYLLAAKRLGVPAIDCVVFEDSPTGIKAARAADMTVVAVLTPYTTGMDLSEAHHQIGSFEGFKPASVGLLTTSSTR